MAVESIDWKPPRPAQPGEIVISIQAEVADGTRNVWTQCTSRSVPLGVLLARWADRYALPAEAVGCELVGTDLQLDLAKTPDELGWRDLDWVHVFALPLDDELAEVEADPAPAAAPASSQAGPMRGEAAAALLAGHTSRGATAQGEVAPSSPAAATTAQAQEKENAPQLEQAPWRAAPAKRAAAEAPDTSAAQASKKPKAAPAAPAAPARDQVAPAAPAGDPGSTPARDEKIAYVMTNPKKRGSKSWDRYEKYKMAKTPNEALSLGSAAGDLKNDFAKGFFRRV